MDSEDDNLQDDLITFNGIDATTGDYLIAPISTATVSQIAINHPPDKNTANALNQVARKSEIDHLGGAFDLNLEDLAQAGWAIIFHRDEDEVVKAALSPLIEHRRQQIGNDEIVKTLEYRDGDAVTGWLARNKIAYGPVEPEKVPYYILIVGSPDRIPFAFGALLDVVYAVGRLHFESVDQYQNYVASVIEYEQAAKAPTGKEVVFWGPSNRNDKPTKLSSEQLIKPLAVGTGGGKSIIERAAKRSKVAYTSRLIQPQEATKENLLDVFRPAATGNPPSLLFTASHGIGWPNGHDNQRAGQGALLCQNFPGRGLGPLKPDHYFAASDLPTDARVHGLVCFHFACFSAGTPEADRFPLKPSAPATAIAPHPFFSALPQALLSHAGGGALGVIGHIERAWQNSIITEGAGAQLLPFENAIGFILSGLPLGWALKEFNEKFAAHSASLTNVLRDVNGGAVVEDRQLVDLWLERNDSEGYVLMGDPAVRLRKDDLLS